MKSLPIAEGGDTVSTLSLSEEEHGRAEKMTADVLDIVIAKVHLQTASWTRRRTHDFSISAKRPGIDSTQPSPPGSPPSPS
jgi:hypothetical protein